MNLLKLSVAYGKHSKAANRFSYCMSLLMVSHLPDFYSGQLLLISFSPAFTHYTITTNNDGNNASCICCPLTELVALTETQYLTFTNYRRRRVIWHSLARFSPSFIRLKVEISFFSFVTNSLPHACQAVAYVLS